MAAPWLSLILLVFLSADLAFAACPPSWAAFGSSCYVFSPSLWDFNTARTLCQHRGGDLVSFTTVEEREFIFSLLRPIRETFWIGATRKGAEESWVWSDGATPGPNDDSIKNWRESCPESCEGDCVQMNHWDGLWTNVGCHWSARAICKRSNDVVDACDFENGWVPFKTSCYKYSQTKRNWLDAQQQCAQGNGKLAVTNTQEKWDLMEELVACKDFQAGIWIGLSDTEVKNEFRWTDGTSLEQTNWDTDQPKNISIAGNNCVGSLPLSNFKWRVDTCDRENEFLCEKPQGSCSEGWINKGTGFCYQVVGEAAIHRRSWFDAEQYCQATGVGGHLMKIENLAQQTALQELAGAVIGIERIRIGLSDSALDNTYYWADGGFVMYQNYGVQEKIVRRVDCGYVNAIDGAAKWNTGYCFDKQAFICQLPIHSSSKTPAEPSGWLCPEGFEADQADGKCYQFFDQAVVYGDTRTACSDGSKVLTLPTPAEQSFISSRLRGRTWIGLEYEGNGRYQWVDQSQLKFENWGVQGPSTGASTRCTSVTDGNPVGGWLDDDCSALRYYACKLNATHSTATTPVPSPTVPWHPQCGPGWSYDYYGQACYRLVAEAQTWENAELACQKHGAHLLSIHGTHEQNYINALVMQNPGWISFWIGGNDINEQLGWRWSDGSPFYFWNWNNDEPNNKGGKEFCIEMSADMLGRWNDIECDREFSYICRKPATTATPAPSAEPSPPPTTCDQPAALISGTHYVRDTALTASSSLTDRSPALSRIYGTGISKSWTATKEDTAPWVGVHFTHYVIITGFMTRGAGDKEEWVTSYKLSYRLQTGSFYEFYRHSNGEVATFEGNTDAAGTKTHTFSPGNIILAHGIRIHPVTYNSAASLRFELLGCKSEACQAQPLVSGESMVPDLRMTSSSHWDLFHQASRARMHSVYDDGYRGGWVAWPWDQNQYLQVEFDTTMAIYAIQTKGRQDYPQWSGTYKLLYAEVSGAFETYQEPYGSEKIFNGNSDSDTLVTNYLAANIYNVKFVRINPLSWTNGISLRLEVLGCSSHRDGCTDIPLITGANNYVPNSRLTASSSWSDTISGPGRSRLNTRANGNLAGAWVPLVNDANQWIQADLGKVMLVMAVATQGRHEMEMYIITYKLSHSMEGTNFNEYGVDGDATILYANWEQHQVHKTYLPNSLATRYLRLHPVSWNVSIALRWEIYACAGWATPSTVGCYADKSDNRDLEGDSISMTPEGMTLEKCVEFCRSKQFLYAGVQLGEACYCGNSYGRHGLSENCDIPCRGDPSKQTMCGGTSSNTILHTGIFSPDQVLGCYGDNPDRDLPYEHYMGIAGGSTQAYCAMHCFNKGYKYAGCQYSNECYCGNTYGRYGPSSYCNHFCAGDRTNQTICGGDWANTVLSTGLADDHPRCRDDWTALGTHCYKIFTERVTWTQAKTKCMTQGAELATVNYAVVNDYIASKAAEFSMNIWIGLHCIQHNNYFEWASGDPVLYTNWNRREPNNWAYDENCVEMYTNGRWNDDPCNEVGTNNGYVCRMNKEEIVGGSTPAPDLTCPQGWVPYRWKCYAATKTLLWNWNQAKAQCETLGGSLARIEDGAEQAFLTASFGLTTGAYWTDLAENGGLFRFSNGMAPPFVNWGQDQPADMGGASCVAINMTVHGLWQNIPCSTQERVMSVCEVGRTGMTKPTPKPTVPGQGSCAPGWTASIDKQNCFFVSAQISNMRRTWTDALAICRDQGGDLVSIHNREENNQLQIYTTSKSGDFWIGLNKRDGSTGYAWSDDTPVDFEFWSGPGRLQDDDVDELDWPELYEASNQESRYKDDGLDCVDLYAATASWNKIACDSKRNWICKIPLGVSPSLTTTPAAPSAGPPGSCSPDNDDWKFFNDQCYYFTGRSSVVVNPEAPRVPETSEFNWWDADERCRVLGGNLVSIHTMEEQQFIEGQVRAFNIEAMNMWIGFNDMNPPSSWQWSDGTPTDFIHWLTGEPNNEGGMELCAAMEINGGAFGTWSDRHCQNARPFICKKNKGGVPLTTPAPTLAPGNCPAGYLTYINKCFKFYDDKVDWSTAHQKCLDAGARPYSLATISDPWEQAFLTSQTRKLGSDRYWIGLHQYHGNNGEFGWIDNTKLLFSNWAAGEPNGGAAEGCVQLYAEKYRAGLWNDEQCGLQLAYLCQRMKDPTLTDGPLTPVNTCPAGYSEWEGNCYKVDSTTRSWQEAENECAREAGSHLTNIIDRAEQAYVTLLMKENQVDLWIGLTDKENAGRYLWTDSTTVRFTNWGPGMPSVMTGGCVHLDYSKYGQWSDKKCDAAYGSLCKITRADTIVTPPPNSGRCTSNGVGDTWVEFGTHCYLFRPLDQVSASTANHRCVLEGAHLASIHSDEENEFIMTHFQTYTAVSQWIGLMKSQQGSFMWSDQSSLGYYNWNENEPNDHNRTNGEDCIEMHVHNGKWNDIPCADINGYICKKRQDFGTGPTPPPTYPPTATVPASTASTTTQSTTSGTPTTTTSPRSTIIVSLPRDTPPPPPNQLSTGGMVGVVFACLVLALVATLAGLLFLKSRGSLAKLDSNGFDNPAFNNNANKSGATQSADANPVYSSSQGVVRFGEDSA